MQIISSCWKCSERHVGCHGSCQRYLDAKAQADKLETMRKNALRAEKEIVGYYQSKNSRLAKIAR